MVYLPPVPVPNASNAAVSHTRPAQSWQTFLKQAQSVSAKTVMPSPVEAGPSDALAATQSVPLRRAVLLLPDSMPSGLAIAVNNLETYLKNVTGKPVTTIRYTPGKPVDLSRLPLGSQVVAIGDGVSVPGLVPSSPGEAQSYAIQASRVSVGARQIDVVGVNGDDLLGSQYGVYRLMTLSGARFFHYDDPYTPPVGQALLPAAGFAERYVPPANMQVRGFAPHEYHPTPLSIDFHDPSPEHLADIERYIDWCVENGQNSVKFELLNLDAVNRYLPITPNHDKFQAWLPYARQILDYAHARGLKVSVNVAFANDVSNNEYAVNPFEALWQTVRLNGPEKRVVNDRAALAKAIASGKADAVNQANAKLSKDRVSYDALLKKYGKTDTQHLHDLVDRLMQAPWDDISWCLGTSEFSSTNDDLTLGWMNEAAAYLKAKYPGTTTTVISHVPGAPKTLEFGDPYFNLADHANPDVGEMVHTTEFYSLTDPALVYGNKNFEGKLKQLYQADPARRTVYEPETSYWVAYDVSVPLFLPVYMLSRAEDIAMLRKLPNISGEETFSTAWEWGYWLSDYAVARMQVNPNENLTAILEGAFAPFGPAAAPAVSLMRDTMAAQQKYLIDQNLMRDLEGWDSLTELGVELQKLPLVNRFLKGTNSSPVRLKPSDIMHYDAKQLDALESGELAQLGEMASNFRGLANRANALRPLVPDASTRYFDEIADGLEANALRAEEVEAALNAAVCARRAQLTHDSSWTAEGKLELARAGVAMQQAMALIKKREKHYRTNPADTYQAGPAPTIWQNRYLTPVDTGEFWKNTYQEVEKLFTSR
ncbi:MAG TPA: hypothetical protein V6D47_20770 [Oscillatoriaceae cyanobacterium]